MGCFLCSFKTFYLKQFSDFQFLFPRTAMATGVTVNWSHVFITRLDFVWRVIIARRYREYRFWRADDARETLFTHDQACISPFSKLNTTTSIFWKTWRDFCQNLLIHRRWKDSYRILWRSSKISVTFNNTKNLIPLKSGYCYYENKSYGYIFLRSCKSKVLQKTSGLDNISLWSGNDPVKSVLQDQMCYKEQITVELVRFWESLTKILKRS